MLDMPPVRGIRLPGIQQEQLTMKKAHTVFPCNRFFA